MSTARSLRLAALMGALVVLGVVALNGGPVSAAKGGHGGTSHNGGGTATTYSITLDQTDPHLGDWVTFTTNGGSRIALACYQGGVGNMVYSADQPVGTAFLLGGTSSIWQSVGGDALCYAWLYSHKLSHGALASTSFTAGGAR